MKFGLDFGRGRGAPMADDHYHSSESVQDLENQRTNMKYISGDTHNCELK